MEYSKVIVILDKKLSTNSKGGGDMLVETRVKSLLALRGLEECEFIEWSASEKNKNLASAEGLIRELLRIGADRKCLLVGVGGGVTTDMVGFVASIYMRGVDFAFIPTTLLAQVDAAIGGKNGVDFDSYKNIVGRINQPKWIAWDTRFIQTLPKAELLNGVAEMLKTFILFDAQAYEQTIKFFKEVFKINLHSSDLSSCLSSNKAKSNSERVLSNEGYSSLTCGSLFSDNLAISDGREYLIGDDKLLELSSLIEKCANYKSEVVSRDVNEAGERRLLNLGHTFGHAIEKCSAERLGVNEQDVVIPHGQAVAVGMIYAAKISLNLCSKGELFSNSGEYSLDRLEKDFSELGLMTKVDIPVEELLEAIKKDKKVQGDMIHLILPVGIGHCEDKLISFEDLKNALC